MVHIYYMRFDPSVSDHEKDLYIQFLSEERQRRVLRIKSSKAALACMQTGLFLRYALEKTGEKNLYQRVAVRRDGKPYIRDSGVYFNLSHSDGYVMLALADSECGLDLQRRVKNQQRLARRVMHREEYASYMEGMEDEDKSELLSWCWCAKEAYLKYTGTGIRYAMSDLNMSDFLLHSEVCCIDKPGTNIGSCYENAGPNEAPFHMLRFRLQDDYYGTICMKQAFCLNIVEAITAEAVFSYFNIK